MIPKNIQKNLKAKKVAVFTEDSENRVDVFFWKIIGTKDQIRKEHFRSYIESEVAKRGLRLRLVIADGDPAAEQLQAKMLKYTETLWIHEWQSNAHRNPVLPSPVPEPTPLFQLMLGPFPAGQGIVYVDPDTKVKCFP
jgi:hypothetical protein